MTITALDRIGLKLNRQKEQQAPPPPSSGLGEAIEQLIAKQVAEQVAAAAEQIKPNPRAPSHRRPFSDKAESHSFPPPPPTTKPPRDMTVQLHRDELKRVNKVSIGDVVFNVQRNQEGRVVRMTTDGDATPPVPPAPLNKG